MKWTIHELIRIYNQDNTFNGDIDFSDWIENTDIIRISNCHIEGDFEIENNDEFVFYMDLKINKEVMRMSHKGNFFPVKNIILFRLDNGRLR